MLDTSRVATPLTRAREQAQTVGLGAQLEQQLTYLDTYAHPKVTRCTLFPDHAPHSFAFQMEVQGEDGVWRHWFSGGLVYHGPHDGHGDGRAPTLTVSITPLHGWQIHT